jgi:4-aminobutyrate aminotransferase-like enzyme
MSSSRAELIKRRERVFGAGAWLFYDEPIHVARGEGVWLLDAEGRRYGRIRPAALHSN